MLGLPISLAHWAYTLSTFQRYYIIAVDAVIDRYSNYLIIFTIIQLNLADNVLAAANNPWIVPYYDYSYILFVQSVQADLLVQRLRIVTVVNFKLGHKDMNSSSRRVCRLALSSPKHCSMT